MISFPHNISTQIRRYVAEISSLAEEFRQHFQDFAAIEKEITLFSSPFSVDPDDATEHLQLELIELQCDAECWSRHQQLPLVDFYRKLDKGRTRRSDSHLRDILRIKTTFFEPDLVYLLQLKYQYHPPH
ncbi:general transcription factor II-I repeat domain-containing protein 2 [Tachysurus ichikawai]